MKGEVLKGICDNQCLIGQPALLPLLAHNSIGHVVSKWLDSQAAEVIIAQSQTGYHHQVVIEKYDPCVNFSQLSERVTGIAINLTTNKRCWETLADHAEFIIQEAAELEEWETLVPSAQELSSRKHLIAYAKELRREAKICVKGAETWQKKVVILLQGIFNLIAQRDQITNIEIARDSRTLAEESKRDSTSMKSIAAVTMAFLPGTFAASVLAMPMFQWDASHGADVVSKRFWVYPLIAIPLTIFTFATWICWIRYKNEHKLKAKPDGKTA